jgi:hypothetical protein
VKTFTTNTSIAPICNVSTYEGPFSYESLWGSDEEAERDEGRLVCDDYKSSAMGERIVREANRVFERDKPLKDYGVVSIKATEFGSPREYNFMTDWLDLSVEVDDTFFMKAKKAILDPANRKAVVKYAGDNWVSRDGFLSSMLDRISTLSRDTWKEKHYGTRMATDEDVEKALVADMDDAFGALENGTSEDVFREFGAILALLWLIEYPSDFDQSDESPMYGSWMTDEMVEHLRGNSSLSEFCTVMDLDEACGKFPEAKALLDDIAAARARLAEQYRKYCETSVSEEAKESQARYVEERGKAFAAYEAEVKSGIEWHWPNKDAVRSKLAEIREEWEAEP